MTSDSLAPARNRVVALRALFIVGAVVLIIGVAGLLVDRVLILRQGADGSYVPLKTLPVGVYSGYDFSSANPAIAEGQFIPLYIGIAVVGLLMLVAAAGLRSARIQRRV